MTCQEQISGKRIQRNSENRCLVRLHAVCVDVDAVQEVMWCYVDLTQYNIMQRSPFSSQIEIPLLLFDSLR